VAVLPPWAKLTFRLVSEKAMLWSDREWMQVVSGRAELVGRTGNGRDHLERG